MRSGKESSPSRLPSSPKHGGARRERQRPLGHQSGDARELLGRLKPSVDYDIVDLSRDDDKTFQECWQIFIPNQTKESHAARLPRRRGIMSRDEIVGHGLEAGLPGGLTFYLPLKAEIVSSSDSEIVNGI